MTTKTNDHSAEAAKHSPPASVQTTETGPEETAHKDQKQHEILEDNVKTGQSERHPSTPAGQHATGSFTGKSSSDN